MTTRAPNQPAQEEEPQRIDPIDRLLEDTAKQLGERAAIRAADSMFDEEVTEHDLEAIIEALTEPDDQSLGWLPWPDMDVLEEAVAVMTDIVRSAGLLDRRTAYTDPETIIEWAHARWPDEPWWPVVAWEDSYQATIPLVVAGRARYELAKVER